MEKPFSGNRLRHSLWRIARRSNSASDNAETGLKFEERRDAEAFQRSVTFVTNVTFTASANVTFKTKAFGEIKSTTGIRSSATGDQDRARPEDVSTSRTLNRRIGSLFRSDSRGNEPTHSSLRWIDHRGAGRRSWQDAIGTGKVAAAPGIRSGTLELSRVVSPLWPDSTREQVLGSPVSPRLFWCSNSHETAPAAASLLPSEPESN